MNSKMNSVTITVASLAIVLMVNTVTAAYISENDILREDYDEGLTYYAGAPVYKPTEGCSSFGGMCVQEDDCAESTSAKGLCADRGANIECCYIVKSRPAPCRQHGGECMKSSCGWNLINSTKVTDCAEDENCCLLE